MELNKKKYSTLNRVKLSKQYLKSQSKTYSTYFAAIAEFSDNSRDAKSNSFHIYSIDTPDYKVKYGLCFLDNGIGMSPKQLQDAICLGKSRKEPGIIGQYGLGLKSASMKLGENMILFTKHKPILNEQICSILLLSNKLNSDLELEYEQCDEIVIPIPTFKSSDCKKRIESNDDMSDQIADEKFRDEMELIYKYSPFKGIKDLKQQFDKIKSETGTLIICYDLSYNTDTFEEHIKLDEEVKKDILINNYTSHTDDSTKFDYESLRAFMETLYFNPKMQIYIFEKRVETKHLIYSLATPARIEHSMSKIQDSKKIIITKAEDELAKAKDNLNKARQNIQSNNQKRTNVMSKSDGLLRNNLKEAEELFHQKTLELEVKKREAKKDYIADFYYGFNIHNRYSDGFFVYHNERLITRHEKVNVNNDSKFNGICGIVNLRYDSIEVTQSKEGFVDETRYKKLIKALNEDYLTYHEHFMNTILYIYKSKENFLKLSGYSMEEYLSGKTDLPSDECIHKEKKFDCKDFRYKALTAIKIQCSKCLKWREISYNKEKFENLDFDKWECSKNDETASALTRNTCKDDQVFKKIEILKSNNITKKSKQVTFAIPQSVPSTSSRIDQPAIPMSSIQQPQSTPLSISTLSYVNSFQNKSSKQKDSPKVFQDIYSNRNRMISAAAAKAVTSAKPTILSNKRKLNQTSSKDTENISKLVDCTLNRVNTNSNGLDSPQKRAKTVHQTTDATDDTNAVINKFRSILSQINDAWHMAEKNTNPEPNLFSKLTITQLKEYNSDALLEKMLNALNLPKKNVEKKTIKRITKNISKNYHQGLSLADILSLVQLS